MNRPPHRFASVAALLLLSGTAAATDPIERASMPLHAKAQSAAERKLDTQLRLQLQGRVSDGMPIAATGANDGPVTVKISGAISPELADAVTAAHGTVIEQSPQWGVMRASLPLVSVLTIAARDDVRRITLPPRARTN